MPDRREGLPPTSTLSTKLEEDFIAPLTAIRGALEILRDYPDLSDTERQRFLNVALSGCARLEQGVADLGTSVYAAGRQENASSDAGREAVPSRTEPIPSGGPFTDRIRLHEDSNLVEVDFGGYVFPNTRTVNEFYDALDAIIEPTGRRWYFLVNYQDCSVWPEAWVAFAHRGKKANHAYSLGTARYAGTAADGAEPGADIFESRELALAHIESLQASH